MQAPRHGSPGTMTPRRSLPAVLLILMGLALGACDNNDSSGPSESVNASAVIRVPAGYPWTGALVDDNGTRQVQGSGPATLGLAAQTGTVVGAVIQKGRNDGVSLQVCIALSGTDSRCADSSGGLAIVQVSGQVINQTTLAQKTVTP